MADIFQEVDQATLEHRFREGLRRYGPFAVAALALVLLGVFIAQVMAGRAETRREEAGALYAAALADREAGRLEAAAAKLDALTSGQGDGYAAFAWLLKADQALTAGDVEAASAAFEAAAERVGDDLYADLAALRSLYAQFDTLSRREVDLLATPLARDERPYRAAARELMAAAALREGAWDQAERAYQALVRLPTTPPGVRARSEAALAVIAHERALARLTPRDTATGGDAAPASATAPERDAAPEEETP